MARRSHREESIWPAYAPVAERRRRAQAEAERLRKKGHVVLPVAIEARVQGSSTYDVKVTVAPLGEGRWEKVVGECSGKVSPVVAKARPEVADRPRGKGAAKRETGGAGGASPERATKKQAAAGARLPQEVALSTRSFPTRR